MIVVDASAALSALVNEGPARNAFRVEQLHVPHLIDAEVASGLRRLVRAQRLDAAAAQAVVQAWQRLGLRRYPVVGVLGRVWQLRDNLSASDACYIALAESLGCGLLTADARLSRAPGISCTVTVVPR